MSIPGSNRRVMTSRAATAEDAAAMAREATLTNDAEKNHAGSQ